jgi:hypothetical protein
MKILHIRADKIPEVFNMVLCELTSLGYVVNVLEKCDTPSSDVTFIYTDGGIIHFSREDINSYTFVGDYYDSVAYLNKMATPLLELMRYSERDVRTKLTMAFKVYVGNSAPEGVPQIVCKRGVELGYTFNPCNVREEVWVVFSEDGFMRYSDCYAGDGSVKQLSLIEFFNLTPEGVLGITWN